LPSWTGETTTDVLGAPLLLTRNVAQTSDGIVVLCAASTTHPVVTANRASLTTGGVPHHKRRHD
jgi:hypothetical protein